MDSTTNATVGTEEIRYRVESNDVGRLWRQETGVFVVSDRPMDFATDADAREAAFEYARTVSSNGMRTRVIRSSERIVFDSSEDWAP